MESIYVARVRGGETNNFNNLGDAIDYLDKNWPTSEVSIDRLYLNSDFNPQECWDRRVGSEWYADTNGGHQRCKANIKANIEYYSKKDLRDRSIESADGLFHILKPLTRNQFEDALVSGLHALIGIKD